MVKKRITKNPEYRDLFPGALEMMILQSLRLKPMHGYALAKHIKQVSDDLLQIEEGSLYPALQRMLKEGWLESEVGVSAKNRPIRIYRLTDAERASVLALRQTSWRETRCRHCGEDRLIERTARGWFCNVCGREF